MRLRTVFHLAALAAVLTLACGATLLAEYNYTEEVHRTFPLTADGRVAVKNINGGIEITTWDRNEVQLDAVKRARSQEYLDELEIVIRDRPDSIEIHTEHPSGSFWNRNGGGSVDYTLRVPRSARLDAIEAVNGRVRIDGSAGPTRAKSVNGGVSWQGAAGSDVDLSTVNGRVEADFDRLTGGSVSVSSVNGTVEVSLPADSSASVTASAVHGGINSDFGTVERTSRYGPGRNLDFELGGGGARMEVKTVNGGIRIQRR